MGVLPVADVSYFPSEPGQLWRKQDVYACGRAQPSPKVAPAPLFCFPELERKCSFEFIFDVGQLVECSAAAVCRPPRVRRVYRVR